MSTRRHIIQILPLGAWAALSGCSDKKVPAPEAAPAVAAPASAQAVAPAPSPASAPSTSPSPVPAPTAAAPGGKVDPSDPTATALGYVDDASTTKNPKHTPGAACADCALFGGKPGDGAGPCPLFSGKLVAATGWCTAYAKKG